MKANLLNDLSNVVKKGTGLACSWSQVGRMSEGGAIEHPLSTLSAPFGTRRRPAGNKAKTSFGALRLAAMVTLLLTLACGNAWGDTYTETYSNPTGTNPAARANGMGAFTTIGSVTGSVSFGNSSLQINSNGASGTFTVSSTDGSYITSITFTQNASYPVGSLTSSDGTVTGPSSNIFTFTPSTETKSSVSFSMSAQSGKKVRLAPIVVNLTSDYEYFSKNFTISSGTVSCTKSNASSDVTMTSTGGTSNNGLTLASGKALTITSAGHNIKKVHFTCESHSTMSNLSANTGTYSSNSWTAGAGTKTVIFTSSGSNATIVGISVELESSGGGGTTYDVTYNANSGGTGTTAAQEDNANGASVTTRANGFTPNSGKKFKWWNTVSGGTGTDYYPGEVLTIASADVELFAQWETVASNEEFWVGSPTTWTSSKFSVGDMDVKTNSTSKATFVTDLTSADSKVNGTDKHANVILVVDNNNYIQVSFSDGSTINDLRLGITTTETSSKNAAVVYSTTEDFSTGEYETKTVSVPANNASTKSLTDFSPATSNKYKYVRIYRKISTAVYSFTGGSGNNLRIYAIKAQKGASCIAPNHVDISGDWDKFGGETISLTATAYSSAGTGSPIADGNITGWQWQKLVGTTWTDVSNGTADGVTTSGATTKNLQISNCGQGNSGKYRCVVSTGATCSTASATATDGSEGYVVKVYALECYTGGTTVYNFTRDGNNQRGSVSIALTASTGYAFKIHADKYYGNDGTINFDENNWTFTAAGNNVTVNSGLGGTFTFTIDYSSNGDVPVLAVTYPRKRIYLEPNSDWLSNSAKFAYYYFHKNGGDTDADGWTDFLTNDDCGRYADISQWNGVQMIAVRFNSSKASTGNWDDKWNQTSDLTVTSNDLITITGWDNSQTYNSTYSTPTYTISYNAGTGGSGTKASESKTCGVAFTLPNSAVFTRTGYTQTGWTTTDGGAQEYALGGTYTTNEDKTFYPVWSCITPEAPAAAKITATDGCSGSAGATFSADDSGKPSYVTWYWQTASDGTSTSYPVSSDYETASTAGSKTMYVRAKNTACDSWSTATSKSATVKTAATIAWNTAPADGTAGGSMTASVTTNYSDGVAYSVQSATPAGCVTVGASTGVISYVAAGTATIRATVTGAGDYCSSAYVDQTITVTAAAVLTALEANTLYEVPDMIPSGASLTTGDQFFEGLSANTKFELIGSASNSKTPKVNNDPNNDRTIDGITFDDGSMWFKGVADLSSNIPTTFGLSFIVPEGGGKLYLYFSTANTNIKLAKAGSAGSTPTLTDGYAAENVTAGTYYLYGTNTSGNYRFYGLKLVTCTTPAAPTAFANTAVTSTTATFSITDAADAASYDLYYASGSPSTPTAGTNATENVTTKTPTITGLTASTTYKIWVRSVCDASHKSDWVALGTTSFTTSAAEPDPLVHWTMKINNSAWGTTATATTDGTNITSINTSRSGTATGTATSATVKVTMASAEVSDNSAPDNSANFTFTVNSAKKVVPEKVTCQVFNVSSGNRTYKAQISDNNGHVYNSTNTLAVSTEATLTDATFNFASGGVLVGDVTLKIYAWKTSGSPTEFRMGQHVKLFGEVQNAADYTVTHTMSNVTKSAGATSVKEGNNYTATYAGAGGYTLPSTISVTIGGSPATAGTDYTWTQGTGVVTIPGNKVTGNIVITVTGDEPAVTHDVSFSLTNVAYSSGDNQGTGAATEGSAFSTVFAASSGYSLPGTITVTIGGVEQTEGTGYTWTQGTGTLTIPAAYVTDDIVVTIVGEEMEGDGCDELVHTEAATATTLTTTVGSATLTSPSGQTANDKAIKLNSSGYIELSPKAGKSFAAGDSLIIVMWNQASSAKTTGYRIAGTDYTASMPSKVNTTFRRKLIAADIVSSKVKIERESANGSNAYFVSAIIKHCEDLPSCTTPTLPTLSNQTVCPGSDIAAWDATPTNIATITGASEDVAYSWKKKGSDTELVATASFDLGSSATESQAGTYVVTVTVSKTGYISKSASAEVDLTVTPATETPSITASKAKVYATDEVTLTATCGSTGVTWNWYLCANADGTGAGSSLGTSATYTIASAPAAGTYYYKAVATGDGTNSCGAAEYVYTLVVSTADACDKEFWFAKEGDRPTGAAAATHITGCPSGSSSASYTASIDGTNYTITGSTGQKTGNVTIVVPADNTGTLYVVVQGSSSRTITLSKGGTQIGQETPENSTWGVFTFDNLDAGTYTLVSSGNISWAMMALKLCPTVACTDDTPTAAATNATVCAGGTITITATGYETGATFQWQKQNATTSVWEDIDGATSDTYTVATAAAEHAGNYHIVATKGCARTSNTVTIAVPSAPVFNSFTTTRRIMETQALSISDVSATDAVSYTWYKSADATWDVGDTEIGTSKNLLKPYAGETAGSTYYIFCRAANSCGTTTSSAITVSVQTLVEEDCAIAGNSGEHNTFAKTSNVSSGTYGSITELHTNSNNKYIYYTAESGYYFATATVNACVGNASDLPTAAYSYSTDGGANWTDQNLTGMTAAYADHVINLPANVNAFRVGRRLGDCGTSSNTIYIHEVCFTYNENCTKTTVDPSSSTVSYTIGDSFTEPTFTVKHNNVAFDPQPTITYTSSDETVATVDDDGTVNFQDKAGTVVITASYAGDATYCSSEGSYTITVSCSDEAPKIIAADGTNIGGCNDEITLEAKKQDGTTNFSDGTYQWYRDGEAISGATDRTYTVSLTGVYSVERTSVGGCVSPSSNKATVTSESAEPEVERLTPFQYYHVDKVYAETSIMRFRHLFAVKNAGTTLEGKHFKMELSRNGGAATDVTNSNAFVMSADIVLLDLNKLYGKYEEDDELVLTCSAVDCEGNVSSIYKNTITIYVIDETPTLALICSGASGDGTRDTKKLVVGGDFLTGYNKADLCVQTGNTSFDKTQEWVLYTRLKENYIVTPVNGYAEFNKLNYEPFDILFLTDYPKASKSDAAATILDDMADLCDYRPLFTFKTHMVHKSPSKWAAKGFMAQPEVPKQSRLRLNIVCYAHPMFDDLKEVSDHIQKDASDHSQIVYTMLTGPGHENSKGMQGFPIDAAEGFVTIGLVHYDATAADDFPSDGYVTWTSGSSDVMMVAAAERQVNLEARMILFSINCGAQSKLTETGRQVVLRSLEYLLSDATITPVADCSFTFTNGAGNDWTYEQYKAKCPACTGTIGDGKWSTAGNWGPDWILQPGKDTEVKIAAPVTVDMPHAKVRTVRILEGGSIEIPAGSGLEVGSTIRRLDGTELSPTEVVDLSIGSTSSGNGTLIFNNNAGDTKAGVAMYSKGFIDYTDPSKPKGIKNYQYIGVPCVNINAAYNYYGSWIYSWSDKGGSYGWQKVVNGGIVTTWTGYCITQESAGTYYAISGTLAATNTVDIDVPAGENMVVGNSWTAPIYIKEFTDDDFENLEGNVYFFNTGVDKTGEAGAAETRYQSSTYVTVPIHSSPYTGDSLISSMQGFFVKSNGSAGALHLDYDRHVRPTTNRNILSGQMHAPRRANAQSDEPAVLKIKVSGENYDDKLLLLAREDFTTGFDNGWDGDKWDGNESALYIYTKDEAGTENSVSAIPEMEGTVIGFRAGEDDAYTLHFEYLNSAEELYLFDTETNAYTKIMTGATYRFFTEDKEKHERFVITRKSPQIATDVDEVDSGKRREVRKLLIEDKMYILLNGMLYDATGKVVK